MKKILSVNIDSTIFRLYHKRKTTINADTQAAQKVIENFFKYYNEKTKEALLSTLTD